PEAHLHRRAVRRREAPGPAARCYGSRAGVRGLAGVPGRVVELDAERRDQRRVVEQRVTGAAVEVRRDAAPGEERLEVDRRALDRGVPTAGPLDLGDLQAAALGGLGDRLGLEHALVECR